MFILCGGIVFVKQKTAYEMRINDWSSDVCSSDRIGQLRFAARGRSEAGIVGESAGLAIEFADVDDVGSDAARQDGAFRALAPQGDGGGLEIGRASCRDRVCQYG